MYDTHVGIPIHLRLMKGDWVYAILVPPWIKRALVMTSPCFLQVMFFSYRVPPLWMRSVSIHRIHFSIYIWSLMWYGRPKARQGLKWIESW